MTGFSDGTALAAGGASSSPCCPHATLPLSTAHASATPVRTRTKLRRGAGVTPINAKSRQTYSLRSRALKPAPRRTRLRPRPSRSCRRAQSQHRRRTPLLPSPMRHIYYTGRGQLLDTRLVCTPATRLHPAHGLLGRSGLPVRPSTLIGGSFGIIGTWMSSSGRARGGFLRVSTTALQAHSNTTATAWS